MSAKIVTEKRITGLEIQDVVVCLLVDKSDKEPEILLNGSDAYEVAQRLERAGIDLDAEIVLNALADFRLGIVTALEHDLQEAHERVEALEQKVKMLHERPGLNMMIYPQERYADTIDRSQR